ncbi:hypothetical protein SF12_06425 [Streptomyces sp. MBRL 601]|nr:hypothetical protein SF12_06425 [Streptomyces sp. MBRL 601]
MTRQRPITAGHADRAAPVGALVELLSTLARRQHEHRSRTADRLAVLAHAALLPDELQEMALYYLAKAQRDLDRSDASRRNMQHVADLDGRLAPAARRGLAHLARLAGDFPTAHATVSTLGWPGRHHRVDGDIWRPHGDVHRAATAYAAARDEADHHASRANVPPPRPSAPSPSPSPTPPWPTTRSTWPSSS